MGNDVGALPGRNKQQVDGLLDDGFWEQIDDRTVLQKGGVSAVKAAPSVVAAWPRQQRR